MAPHCSRAGTFAAGATAFLLLFTLLGAVVPALFGGAPVAPRVLPLSPLASTRHLVYFMVWHLAGAVVQVRSTIQRMIDGRLARRRSVWFG